MFKKISFKFTVLHVFLILILVIVIAISGNFYIRSSKAVLSLAERISQEVNQKIIERTISFMMKPARYAQINANMVSSADVMTIRDKMWEVMWQELLTVPQVQSIFVADQNGSYVQVRRNPKLANRYINRSKTVTTDGPKEKWFYRDAEYNLLDLMEREPKFDPRTRPWFKETTTEKKLHWTPVYIFTTAQTPGITVTYPVVDETGKLTVVAVVNIALKKLSQFIAQQKVSENGLVYITNSEGELIAYPDISKTMKPDPENKGKLIAVTVQELDKPWIVDSYKQFKKTGDNKIISTTNGVKYISTFTKFPSDFEQDWYIVSIIPEDDILGTVNKTVYQTIIITLVILGISLIIVFYIANKLSRPIERLAVETGKIKNFDLDGVASVDSNFKEVSLMNQSILATTKGLKAFQKYVPAALVRALIETGEEARLGGKEMDITIFFSDIANFTSISEKMSAEALTIHLSQYLDELTRVIMNQRGTIDKYIGDAIMAFWGAPTPLDNAPLLACKAALYCQRRIIEMSPEWEQKGLPVLHTRFGIHSGHGVVGNLGSSERMNYSVIGDSVNLASRLEAVNKLYGTHIVISHDTYNHVKEHFICRLLDVVAVKGKEKGIRIYELVEEVSFELDPSLKEKHRVWGEGMEKYLHRDWTGAVECFKSILVKEPEDKAAKLFIDRCNYFTRYPDLVPEDWDGTTQLTEKC